MNPPLGQTPSFDEPAAYQITIQGVISPGWSQQLEEMNISHMTLENGTSLTTLTGELADQAALSGVLNTIYELRLPLIAVNKLPIAGSRRKESRPDS